VRSPTGTSNQLGAGISPILITPPKPLPQFILRQNLLNRIDQIASRLTIITAPTGYGKSALAAQWVARNSANAIWYSVAPEHTPVDTFEHLIAAVRLIVPDFAPWAESQVQEDFDFGRAIMKMANDLSSYDRKFSMVVDGSDQFTHSHSAGMQNFINSASSNIRILSLRNNDSNLDLTRLQKAHELLNLTAQDLALSAEEKIALAQLYKLDSEDPLVLQVLNDSDGWPAGVQLLAKSMAEYGVESVSKNRNIAMAEGKVLLKYAVDNLPAETLDLLESLSFMEIATEEEIKILVGSSIGFRTIDSLSETGIYIERVGDAPYKYRINDFIRNEIRSRLDSDQVRLRELANLSADLALQSGQIIRAIEIYTHADLNEEASKLVIENIIFLIYSGNARLLATWLPRLRDIRQWTPLQYAIAKIYEALALGKIEDAKAALLDLQSSEGLNNSSEIAVLQAQLEFLNGSFSKSLELSRSFESLDLLSGIDVDFRHIAAIRVGIASAFLSGNFDLVSELALSALETDIEEDLIVSTILMPGARSMISFTQGKYKEAELYARLAIQGARNIKAGGANLPFEAAFVLADVLLEFGDEEGSLDVVREFLPKAIEYNQWPWVTALLAKAALVRLQQGKVSEALGLIRQAREYGATPAFDAQIYFMIDFAEVFVRLAMNDMERIFELLGRLPDNKFSHAFLMGLQAKQAPHQAQKVVSALPEKTDQEQFIKELFFAEMNSENRPVAMRHLQRAVDLAIPNGYFRSFINLSETLKNLILDLANKTPTVFLENLASVIRAQSMARSQFGESQGHSLTKRELEILRRLSTGLPIGEIAKTLNISQNTIKTHLKNLYRKLNVESRAGAIKVGQELLLL